MKYLNHATSLQAGTMTVTLTLRVEGLADAATTEGIILSAVRPEAHTAAAPTPSPTPTRVAPLPMVATGTGSVTGAARTKRAPASANTSWNDDDDLFVIEHYGQMKTAKIAAKLGRTSIAINSRASNLRREDYPIPMIRPGVSKAIYARREQRRADAETSATPPLAPLLLLTSDQIT